MIMWTCNNCENANGDGSHICDVCGATYPDITLHWKNRDGKDKDNDKAILSWDSYYCRSIFAVYGGKYYYLSKKKSIDFPIMEHPENGTIYFCSTGGYVKVNFTIGVA